ncbi:GTPase [Nitrincola tapanii]|uniref:G domain-containing protein n=1 Tax=Nitrincola tapanii TaxID=1708751 RepID=A0A5A9W1X7_9GAMM|nr:GTPase [Nitrincola tapanii]KAA0874800.1 hypothetical protein E1H14_08280 [Nitrincola tapanii]
MKTVQQFLIHHQPELYRALQQLDDLPVGNDALTLTVVGLVKAGKSTLLNVLTDNLEQEFFKTARSRETRELKTLRVGQIDYTDTPGLDAEDTDDQVAFDGIVTSDLLLLCHSMGQGELDQPTLDYLSRISQHSQRPLADRLVCVLTKAEQPDEAQHEFEALIASQLVELCGGEPDIFRVSANTYLSGVRQAQPLLIQYSGIPALQDYLQQRVEVMLVDKEQHRAEQRETLANTLADRLQEMIAQEEQAFADQHQALSHRVDQLGQTLSQVRTALQRR